MKNYVTVTVVFIKLVTVQYAGVSFLHWFRKYKSIILNNLLAKE